MNIARRPLLKSHLAAKLEISPQTLYRLIKEREEKIRIVYPLYKTRSQLLQPKVIDFLIKDLGYSPDEIYIK